MCDMFVFTGNNISAYKIQYKSKTLQQRTNKESLVG